VNRFVKALAATVSVLAVTALYLLVLGRGRWPLWPPL
jgi:hypothetical protein